MSKSILDRQKRDELLIRLDEHRKSQDEKLDNVIERLDDINGEITNHSVSIGITRRWIGALSGAIALIFLALIRGGVIF